MKKKTDAYFLNTLEKGLEILNLFTPEHTSWTLNEIAQNSNLNKTTAYRYVNTLIQMGYLRKDPRTKILTVGPVALSLSYSLQGSFDLLRTIKPIIDQISDELNVTVDSTFWDGRKLIVLHRREAKNTLIFRLPPVVKEMYCIAAGKAILAHLPESEMLRVIHLQNLVRRTPNTIYDKEALIADLEKTKRRGYALNNEEYIPGLLAIAAPFFNLQTNKVLGTVDFDFSTVGSSIASVEKKLAGPIIELANTISKAISGIEGL